MCGGAGQGYCNRTNGTCACAPGGTGRTCDFLYCPGEPWHEAHLSTAATPHRSHGTCAGHGLCDPLRGTCSCDGAPSSAVDLLSS